MHPMFGHPGTRALGARWFALAWAILLLPACAAKWDAVAPPPGRSEPRFEEPPVPRRDEWIARLLRRPEAEIDLVEAAVVLANHRLGESRAYSEIPRFLFPTLERVRRKVGDAATPDRTIDALTEELLPLLRQASSGSLKWLFEALAAEEGPCVVHTLLFVIAGDALGIRLEPVLIPTHAFVAFSSAESRRNIETTDRGQHWTAEEYRRFLLREPTALQVLPEEPTALERAFRAASRRRLVAVLLMSKSRQRDVEEFELAAQLDPDFEGPPIRLSGYYALRDDYARAERFSSEAIKKAPHLPGLYAARASSRGIMGKLSEALEDIEAALRLAPSSARYHHIQGLALLQAERLEEALASFSRAIEGAPRSCDYRLFRAMALKRLGRFAEAVEDCSAAITLDPKNPKPYRRRAQLWSLLGDERNAAADVRTADALDQGS